MREYKSVYATHVLVAFALAVSVLSPPVSHKPAQAGGIPDVIIGTARVVDGDTLDIGEVRIRLEGIDAPETKQTCQRRWVGSWHCGGAATLALEQLVAGQTVRCERRGVDKYGRTLAVCFVAGRDINAQMVRQGYAWAFVKYSTSYVGEEAAAKAEGLGIWQGEAQPPWEYRHKHWETAELKAPNGCAIKGNITKNGRIYHMPWSPWYEQIRMEPEKGKRWFCSEAEAIAAGWRPVQAY
jgi:endonuclease YncB( thermonuclease family)